MGVLSFSNYVQTIAKLAKISSRLDIQNAFHQLEISPKDEVEHNNRVEFTLKLLNNNTIKINQDKRIFKIRNS